MSDKLQEFEVRVQALELSMPEPLGEIRETVAQELKIREGVADGLAQDVLQLKHSSNEAGQKLMSHVRESVSTWSKEISGLENGVKTATESSWNVPPKDRAKELILKSILTREAAQDEVIAGLESYLEELDRQTERAILEKSELKEDLRNHRHMLEERNIVELKDNDDEEDLYSAVVRPGENVLAPKGQTQGQTRQFGTPTESKQNKQINQTALAAPAEPPRKKLSSTNTIPFVLNSPSGTQVPQTTQVAQTPTPQVAKAQLEATATPSLQVKPLLPVVDGVFRPTDEFKIEPRPKPE